MKVLIAHNRYRQAGGEDNVAMREAAMLARHGHRVEFLSVDNDAIVGAGAKLTTAFRSLYSVRSHDRAARLLASFRPDILHVHNFFPTLSPSIFFAANSAHVPVIQTLHNYRIVCANAEMFRDGLPCEDCLGRQSFLPAVRHACYRGSRLGSAVVGAGMLAHAVIGTWGKRIDRYIALTAFAAEKLGSARIPADRIRIKPNFIEDLGVGSGDGGFALFVGRLSPEKGVATLLDADATGRLPLPIHIAGDGPMLERVRTASRRPGSKLVVLGMRSTEEVQDLMRAAAVLLVPSLWYEGSPLVMVEALSFGLPIIASRIGGLPEIVEERISGLLCEPGSVPALLETLTWFTCHPDQAAAMRTAARQRYLDQYTESKNYDILMGVYNELFQMSNAADPSEAQYLSPSERATLGALS